MGHGNSNYTYYYNPNDFLYLFKRDPYLEFYLLNMPFSYNTYVWLDFYLRTLVTSLVAFFGLTTNCINITIFYRQGPLSHSCTMSLLALAMADGGFCFVVLCGSVLSALNQFHDSVAEWNWSPAEFIRNVTSTQEPVIAQIGGGIMAFMSVERFFSVMFPFKVKAIFTPKRSCAVIVCMSICVVLLWGINTCAYLPEWKWDAYKNKNVLEFRLVDLSDTVLAMLVFSSYAGSVVLPALGVTVVFVCNFIIYWKVNMSKQFRKVSAPTTTHNVSPSCQDPNSSNQEGSKEANSQKTKTDITYNSKKEINLFRMLTVVCFVYGITYTLSFLRNLILYNVGWELDVDYHAFTADTTLFVLNLFQAINASCNIIIYYTMNSRYKRDLQLLMCYWKHRKT